MDRRYPSVDKNFVEKVVGAVRERMKTIKDFWEFGSFFFELPDYEPPLLYWQDDTPEKTQEALQRAREKIASLGEVLSQESLLSSLQDLIEEYGRGSVLWPLRVALSGRSASPDPLQIVTVLGRDESLRRIDVALKKYK